MKYECKAIRCNKLSLKKLKALKTFAKGANLQGLFLVDVCGENLRTKILNLKFRGFPGNSTIPEKKFLR